MDEIDNIILKKLIENQQNMAKIPIMDTDSMDTHHGLSSVEQRTYIRWGENYYCCEMIL